MEESVSQDQFKNLIKAALIEVFEERRDLLHDAVETALEDIGLVRAIHDGLNSDLVDRDEVFKLLEGRP
ncbi:MAG TPA: hypothetical protein VNS63_00355 [Blastocatellia bacterium]|nr:hypothetical protein [Blastocatellia bacterium]